MKFGCFGCLFLIMIVAAVLVVGVGVLIISGNIFGSPEARPIAFSKADGYAAQQKLYEVILRQAGRSSRKDPITLTEREASAFLSRHLAETSHVPLSDLTVRFEPEEFVAQGQTALRNLVQGPPFSYIVPYIPDKRLDQAVWISIRGRITIEVPATGARRYGKVTVTGFMLGRQPISPVLLYVTMGPFAGGLLEWPVPGVVESVRIEKGQAIIRTR